MTQLDPEQEWEDKYRWCVFCGADCFVESVEDIEHSDDCPAVTGVFPVRESDVTPHGFGCCRCEHQFDVGDHYHRIQVDDVDGTPIAEVVCASCAAHHALLG